MNQIHCVRCTYTSLMHGRAALACADFIAPSSPEARELTRVDNASDLRSDTIDRARLVAINKAQWAAIKKAKGLLLLALEAHPMMFKVHCQAALIVLRGIGDS